MVDQNSASWNPVICWLRRIERLKLPRDRRITPRSPQPGVFRPCFLDQ